MVKEDKRRAVIEMLKNKPYVYDSIPLSLGSERDLFPSGEVCPVCGGMMWKAMISSPANYWQNLCGREGVLLICGCGHIGNFILQRMN